MTESRTSRAAVFAVIMLLLTSQVAFADHAVRAPRIIHISDLHFTDSLTTLDSDYWVDSQNSHLRSEVLSEYLITNKARLGTDRIVITGDLTDSGDAADYAIARAFIKKLKHRGFEVYCVPGNHDCSKEGTLILGQREVGQGATRRENFGRYIDNGQFPRAVKLHKGWLILLDSMQGAYGRGNLGQGALGPEQLVWLRREVERLQKDRRSGKRIIVCLHHSPFKLGERNLPSDGSLGFHPTGGLDDAREFLAIIAGKIDCLLFGHTTPSGVIHQGPACFQVQRDVYGIPMINCVNFEHTPWSEELPLPGTARQLCMTANQDGRIEIFYISPASEIFHNWQVEPNGAWNVENPADGVASEAWHGEETLGGNAKQICAGRNQDGLLEIFYVTADGRICHNRQTAPGGPWHGEEVLDSRFLGKGDEGLQQICAAQNRDGRLEVFYVGADSNVKHLWQTNSGEWDGEDGLGGPAEQIWVGRNQDGRFEVFYTDKESKIWHNRQAASFGGWNGGELFEPCSFLRKDDAAQRMCVSQNQNGCLDVLYAGANDEIIHNRQTVPNGDWSGEKGLGKFFANRGVQLCAGSNKDGRLEVFYAGTNSLIYHNYQTSPNGDWAGEELLRGLLESARHICAGLNRDGRIEICYIGANGRLYHMFQTVPNAAYPISVIDLDHFRCEVFYTDAPTPAATKTLPVGKS